MMVENVKCIIQNQNYHPGADPLLSVLDENSFCADEVGSLANIIS